MTNQSGSLEGCVTMHGKPRSGVELELIRLGKGPFDEETVAKVKTGEDGRYRFTNLPSSHYRLRAIASEYISTDKQNPEMYEEGLYKEFTVTRGESVKDADLHLVLGGVISGQIIDADGKPIAGEKIKLLPVKQYRPLGEYFRLCEEFLTDKEGNHRLYGIPPGQYMIGIGVDDQPLWVASMIFSVAPPGNTGMVAGTRYFEQTFYPGVRDIHSARILTVSIADELKDINFSTGRGLRAYSVSGRVVEEGTGKPVSNCGLIVGNRTMQRGLVEETDEAGNFEISGFLPGNFGLSANLTGETNLYSNTLLFEIKDQDLIGVEIKVRQGITVSGTCVIEGSKENVFAKLSEAELNFHSRGQQIIWKSAKINPDGSFKIRGLTAGEFRLDLDSSWFEILRIEHPNSLARRTETVPADNLMAKMADRIAGNRIMVGDQDLQDIRIILAYSGGIIKGHVDLSIIKAIRADVRSELQARISGKTTKGMMSTYADVDADGNFEEEGLEPGEYEVFIEHGDDQISETKLIMVTGDAPTEVTFAVDELKRKK